MSPYQALIILTLALGPGLAQAAVAKSASIHDMARQSEMVFLGRVTQVDGRKVFVDPPPGSAQPAVEVWSDIRFVVERTLYGRADLQPSQSLVLTQRGGEAGSGRDRIRQQIGGYPRFTVGERVVVFLERTDTGRQVVTGMAQGKYTVTIDPTTGQTIATRDLTGLVRVGGPAPGTRPLVGLPATHDRLSLGQLETLVQGRRPNPRPVNLVPARPTIRTPQVTVRAPEVSP